MKGRDAVVVLGRRHGQGERAVPSQAAQEGGGRGLDEVLGEHTGVVLFDDILLGSIQLVQELYPSKPSQWLVAGA